MELFDQDQHQRQAAAAGGGLSAGNRSHFHRHSFPTLFETNAVPLSSGAAGASLLVPIRASPALTPPPSSSPSSPNSTACPLYSPAPAPTSGVGLVALAAIGGPCGTGPTAVPSAPTAPVTAKRHTPHPDALITLLVFSISLACLPFALCLANGSLPFIPFIIAPFLCTSCLFFSISGTSFLSFLSSFLSSSGICFRIIYLSIKRFYLFTRFFFFSFKTFLIAFCVCHKSTS